MLDDTIAAVSTPIGEGGIGIVRISGPDAIAIASSVFTPADGESIRSAPSHTIHYGHVDLSNRRLDEVLVSVMHAPRTYTREDVVEINCHGGVLAVRAVLDAVLECGARLAERGEFTQRAFVNGRISLDQAQAVLDVVRARTSLGLEAAVDRLGGRFSDAIAAVRDALAGVLAQIEVQIDFPDVDVSIESIEPQVDVLLRRVGDLVARAKQGRVVREGATVVIAGRPNVGKSTLLNALLGEDRAIVTPIPGTTRDTVEEIAEIGGIPVRLIDTAGLRDPDDPVESEGVKRARVAMDRADLILLLVDRSEPATAEDHRLLQHDAAVPTVLLRTKCDLPSHGDTLLDGGWLQTIDISAMTGQNLDTLRRILVDLLSGGDVPARHTMLLLDGWERDLLRRLYRALEQALDSLQVGESIDIVSEELHAAYRAAGELQGIDVSESILDAVFSRFCVGK